MCPHIRKNLFKIINTLVQIYQYFVSAIFSFISFLSPTFLISLTIDNHKHHSQCVFWCDRYMVAAKAIAISAFLEKIKVGISALTCFPLVKNEYLSD